MNYDEQLAANAFAIELYQVDEII